LSKNKNGYVWLQGCRIKNPCFATLKLRFPLLLRDFSVKVVRLPEYPYVPLFIKKAKRLCKSGYFGKVAKVESTVFLDMTGFSVKVAKIAKVYINAKKPPVLERSKKNGRPMRLCRNIQFTHLRRSLPLYIMEA